MRIVDCGIAAGFPDSRFGSEDLTVTPLARDATNVVLLHVAAGGRIGRHRAVGHQVFAVLAGAGWVSGTDGVRHRVRAGQAVAWEPGEEHETVAETALTAVVSEGDDVRLLLPFVLH